MAPDQLTVSNHERPARRSFLHRHRWLLWTAAAALAFVVALGAVLVVLAQRIEPYLRARIVDGLSQRFHSRVELDQFHVAVDRGQEARWGMWATGRGLRIWPPRHAGETDQQSAPLIQIDEFTFHVPLRYELTRSVHIAEIRLSGLDIRVPPHRDREQRAGFTSAMNTPPASPSQQSTLANVRIDRVLCQNAQLVFESSKPEKPSLDFNIARLELTHLTPGQPVRFSADLTNPSPRGAIHSTGEFGPWVASDPGTSPMRGTYTFRNADLSTIRDIQGTLSSTGSFGGLLGALVVDGQADVPNFRLTHFGNALPLATRFHARVDGTNGDTWLEPVDATLGSAHFTIASGNIVRVRVDNRKPPPGSTGTAPMYTGHIIDLKIEIDHTRIDDFLRLVSHLPTPILTGNVTARAVLHIPPGPEPVHRRVKIDGSFQLRDVRFSDSKVQQKVEDLSLHGLGHPNAIKDADPSLIRSRMQSDFHLEHAVIALPNLDYIVPGADIQLDGTYALDGQLHFDGTARMEATLSKMVGGWKGILLKPADRFFKKDGAGTSIPIRIRGTRQAPDFSIDLGRIRHPSPQSPGVP